MTIDPEQLPEMLAAYADGELDPLAARQVERAIAADPALADQVERHRALRATLAAAFAPIAAAPVPDRLIQMVPDARVVDLAAARAARARAAAAPERRWRLWAGMGGMMAASLVLGVLVGRGADNGPIESRDGMLVASGGLGRALDTQLASADGGNSAPHILVSFRDGSGRYCRSFSGAALSGIACKEEAGWVLRETRGGGTATASEFRQAGSADAALMADAQAMMAGEPLDAAAEEAARAKGWR